MNSMTGFGFAEYHDSAYSLSVDLKSYNHRFLDISVSLPASLSQLEPRVRESVAATASRGRVEVYVRLTELQEELEVIVDRRAAEAYRDALRQIVEQLQLEDRVTLSHLLHLEGVIKTEKRSDPERLWATLGQPLERALGQWNESRAAEGARLLVDIRELLEDIGRSVDLIDSRRDGIERHIREDVRRRFEEVLGNQVDEQRVLSEIAALLARFDINEEVVRLRAHLESFRESIAEGGVMGKRLDFLVQEMGREVNTVGSKSPDLEISRAVIGAKDSLEKVREQLRNVE